jgi:aryl-alcohol dehydrogenase-like predicted oxidoreductase
MAVPAPAVILGCGTFGGIGGARQLIGKGLDQTAAAETMDEAVRLDLLWWDTAERYADGASERMIGDWLSNQPEDLAGRVRIATKVAPPSLAGNADRRFDRNYIESKIEASLLRLQRPQVHLYLAHAACKFTPVEQVVEGFAAVLESGRAERIGCCNVDPDQLTAALDAAERLGSAASNGCRTRSACWILMRITRSAPSAASAESRTRRTLRWRAGSWRASIVAASRFPPIRAWHCGPTVDRCRTGRTTRWRC